MWVLVKHCLELFKTKPCVCLKPLAHRGDLAEALMPQPEAWV